MHELTPRPLLDAVAGGARSGADVGPVLSVDLVGFTPLAWSLATQGFRGAEALAEIADTVFSSITNAIHAYGGHVGEFGGDAVLGVFPPGLDDRHGRALAAALEIAAHGRDRGPVLTALGSHQVGVKVGVADGEVRWDVLDDASGRVSTYVYWGDGVVRAAQLAAGGSPGRVGVDERVAAALGRRAVVAETVGMLVIADVVGRLPSRREPVVPTTPHPLATRFAPPRLLSWDRRGELRPVVTTFLGLGADATIDDVRVLVEHLFRLRETYGGVVHQIERAEKGWVVLLYSGAPLSFPGDVERALSLLLALHEECPVPFRSGTTIGTAYSGMVGGSVQSGFSCYGSHINVAARMMGAAPVGAMRVDRSVLRQAAGIAETRSLGSVSFKGVGEPVEVFELGRPAQNVVRRLHPLVGREDEVAAVEAVINASVRDGDVRRLVLSGEPGVGKTSLLAEIRRHREGVGGGQWLVSRAESHGSRGLSPVRDLVRRWANVTVATDSSTVLASLRRRAEDDGILLGPRWAQRLDGAVPVLAALLDLRVSGSEWAAIAPEDRREALTDAVAALIGSAAAAGSAVLVVDDVQWCDDESADLLRSAVQRVGPAPLTVVVTCHDPGQSAAFLDRAPADHVAVGRLGEAALARLASDLLGSAPPRWLPGWLAARTEGNPLFAEQLVAYLAARGSLAEASPPPDLELPPDLRGVLVAALDRLSAPARQAAEAAAVIGRRFERTVLARMLAGMSGGTPEDAPDLAAVEQLEPELLSAGIWSPERDAMAFAHELLWSAAGDMALTSTLRALHATAASALEAEPDDGGGRFVARLAVHHRQAGHPLVAARYEVKASDQALLLGAYRNAAEHAERGLADLAGAEPARDVELMLVLALGSSRMITHGQAAPETRAAYERAHAIAEALPANRQSFQALFGLRMNAAFRGDLATATALGERALAMAESLGDDDLLLEALLMVGNTQFWRGDVRGAIVSLERVRAAQSMPSHGAFVQQRRLTALFPMLVSRWIVKGDDACRDEAEAGVAEARELGHRFSEAIVVETAAFLAVLSDRPDDAERHGEALLQLAEAEGFPTYVTLAHGATKWAAAVRHPDQPALVDGVGRAARDLATQGVVLGQTLMLLFEADAAARAGLRDRVEAVTRQALDLAGRTGERVFVPELMRVRASALAPARAAQELRGALDLARATGQDAVAGRIVAALAQLVREEPHVDDLAAEDHEKEQS